MQYGQPELRNRAVCMQGTAKQKAAREEKVMNEEIVLCAASAYEQKFYLNPEFESLPENIRQEPIWKKKGR